MRPGNSPLISVFPPSYRYHVHGIPVLCSRGRSASLVLTGPSLKADLDRYAALHARAYGEAVDAVTLIPHMLEAFMARDRGFRRSGSAKPASG